MLTVGLTGGITVGLTGGIGSGKSTAAELLSELGATVIDADRVGHEVYLPGTKGWDQVVAAFGEGVVGDQGSIDRKQLGAIVFADEGQLAKLNGIVHPLIRDAVRDKVAAAKIARPAVPVVIEAAVLIEAKWYDLVDEVWVVVAEPQTVIERVTASRGLDESAVRARIDAQLSNQERTERADVVIDNNGSLDELRTQVERLSKERLFRVG